MCCVDRLKSQPKADIRKRSLQNHDFDPSERQSEDIFPSSYRYRVEQWSKSLLAALVLGE